MRVDDPVHVRGWTAELDLRFEPRGPRTVLASRRHDGPLVVQKALYPEGDKPCHAIIVHPPAGIAGGDDLAIDIKLERGAHALLTTPGAAKWYRSAGPWARHRVALDVADGAILEWLPQETLVYDGALAEIGLDVRLSAGAVFIGWDIVCLGRTGSGERLRVGELRQRARIERGGRPLWIERGRLDPSSGLLASPVGLGGEPVFGTMMVAAPGIDAELLAACRAFEPALGRGALTRLPGVLLARYVGPRADAARDYFAHLWSAVRPAVAGRVAAPPRIWST